MKPARAHAGSIKFVSFMVVKLEKPQNKHNLPPVGT